MPPPTAAGMRQPGRKSASSAFGERVRNYALANRGDCIIWMSYSGNPSTFLHISFLALAAVEQVCVRFCSAATCNWFLRRSGPFATTIATVSDQRTTNTAKGMENPCVWRPRASDLLKPDFKATCMCSRRDANSVFSPIPTISSDN